MNLNPLNWWRAKTTTLQSSSGASDLQTGWPPMPRPIPPPPQPPALLAPENPPAESTQHSEAPVKSEEITMSTAAVVSAVPAQKSAFIRFIDKIGTFFKQEEPTAVAVAVEAEPILALTPFGPEYDLVVNAIVGVQKTANAALAAGTGLTGEERMALVVQIVTPALTGLLASKGIDAPADVTAEINRWSQVVYDILTGSVVAGIRAAIG